MGRCQTAQNEPMLKCFGHESGVFSPALRPYKAQTKEKQNWDFLPNQFHIMFWPAAKIIVSLQVSKRLSHIVKDTKLTKQMTGVKIF